MSRVTEGILYFATKIDANRAFCYHSNTTTTTTITPSQILNTGRYIITAKSMQILRAKKVMKCAVKSVAFSHFKPFVSCESESPKKVTASDSSSIVACT